MSSPPAAPLPSLTGLKRWKKIIKDADNTDDTSSSSSSTTTLAQKESFHESLIGKQFQQCQDSCKQYKDKVEEYAKDWQEARKKGDEYQAGVCKQRFREASYYYNVCQLKTLCPNQLKLYSGCWNWFQKSYTKNNEGGGPLHERLEIICSAERAIVERCIGRFVASSVDSLEDDNTTNITNLSSSSLFFGNNGLDNIHETGDWR